MKLIGLVIVILVGGLLIYATVDFPPWADPGSPASTHVSPYYIENTLKQTSVPNIVTAVVADYRGYDTMFETTVIFTAGVACFILLRTLSPKGTQPRFYRHIPTGITLSVKGVEKIPENLDEFERIDKLWTPHDVIIRTMCRLLVPFIQLFGLYTIAHGHHSPGGGFQGGVILGASIIVLAISYNLRAANERFNEVLGGLLGATGVFIYAGTGALCLLLGLNFLDYHALAGLLRVGTSMARSHGVFIVEVGVGVTVMATMIWIYNNLASAGKYDEGL